MRLRLALWYQQLSICAAMAVLFMVLDCFAFPPSIVAIGVCDSMLSPDGRPGIAIPEGIHKRRGTNGKVIRDPVEYNTYLAALNASNPALKAERMEAFVSKYPQSTVKSDALIKALSAYKQLGNAAMVENTAERLVKADPDELPALAVLAAVKRSHATNESNLSRAEALTDEVIELGKKGLAALANWEPSDGSSVVDTQLKCKDMAVIFSGAMGFGALKNKDYVNARQYLTQALRIDPENLEDMFQLAIADLQMSPIDLNGLWYCGKAVQLAQTKGNSQVHELSSYCQEKYSRHTGRSRDWEQFILATSKDAAPPSNFAESLSSEAKPTSTKNTTSQSNALSLSGALSQSSSGPSSEKGDRLSRLLGPPQAQAWGIGSGRANDQPPTVVSPPRSSPACKTPDHDGCYTVGNGVSSPILLSSIDPQYPKSAKSAGMEGIERLEVIIGADGNVYEPRILKSLSPDFDEQAMAVVKQWKFKPATKDGKPVPVRVNIEANFRLGPPTGSPRSQQ